MWVSQVITRWLRPSGHTSILTRAEIRDVARTGYRDGHPAQQRARHHHQPDAIY